MDEAVRRGQGAGQRALGDELVQTCMDAGASIGMLYLPGATRRVLHLAMVTGVAREFAAPWSRIGLDDPIPVADAVRERRFVWLGDQQETARRYPRLGLVLPYDFALAAAPLTTATGDQDTGDRDAGGRDSGGGDTGGRGAEAPDGTDRAAAHGGGATADADASRDPAAGAGAVLLWPGSHASRLSDRERRAVEAGCHRLARVLRGAADEGHPVPPADHPVILQPALPPTPGPVEAGAALAFARRLPGGSCALDMNGQIVFLTPEAAALLGVDRAALLGALPWEALPWMDTPAVEDHYRAAVISRVPQTFTTMHPSGRHLRFDLYPDDTGISVRITPAAEQPAPPPRARPAAPAREPSPSRATALYQLMHLAATLTEAAHAQDVVEKAADQLVPALGAQALALLVEEGQRQRIVGHRGYPAAVVARFDGLPVTEDLPTNRVLRTGTALFYSSAEELFDDFHDTGYEPVMAAWAFLPLIASRRPIGSLVLAYTRPHPFAPGERAVLTSIAGLIAQALDRARLYDSTHQLARSLQTGLLPHALPVIPHLDLAARYQPAAHGLDIGGDFYDVIRIDDTTVAAAIGDVQGHNVNAAALMGQVRTAVHATAGAPPAEVLARTNRLLTDLEPGLFTSCLYAHLDLARGTAHLAGAGHPPPVLRHAHGPTEVLHLPSGLLLGIDPDASYSAVEIPFAPDTLLALYTDGLVETPGEDIEDAIGTVAARIGRAPRLQSLGDLADDLVRDARHGAPRTDDIALLLLRSREAPAPGS
ncbi:SpoIIE family protein phosphatase [Streptomyces sp. NPDC090022]|uniref:SpoIIE family protein phosphatase n=1 Tax=Streptomyces sp. NPDC090022 TaxID=3365920 RepID=UPI003804B42F